MELLRCTGYVYEYTHEMRDNGPVAILKKYLCIPTHQESCQPGYGCVTQLKFLRMDKVDRLPTAKDLKRGGPHITEEQFNEWLSGITAAYPSIKTISLIGSRARGQARPGSDWDVLISLDESCYKDNKPRYNRDVERMIAYDKLSSNPLIDLWFLRPNGIVARDVRRDLRRDFFSIPGFRPEDPLHAARVKGGAYCKGLWDDLYRDVENAVLVYKRGDCSGETVVK